MTVIVVASPKGGVGKSTLSTQIAGCLARQGQPVALGDLDRQQSAMAWLGLRPTGLSPIVAWPPAADGRLRPPKGVAAAVLDTPAGLHGKALEDVVKLADKLVVPLQPSLFDIYATREFVATLQHLRHSEQVAIGLVAMRVREGTLALEQLNRFLDTLAMPVVAQLRDTQNYVHLAAHGLTLWDVAPSRVERDLAQWAPLQDWLA